MNKADLITVVAEKSGFTKKDTEKIVNTVLDTIVETVASETKVQLVGFGHFEVSYRKERIGRDPRTTEAITIPATKVPVFKAGKVFKEAVKK